MTAAVIGRTHEWRTEPFVFATPPRAGYISSMRVLCVARHPILSEHLGRFFEALGVDTVTCVGLEDAMDVVVDVNDVDAVICDYDVLAAMAPDAWATSPLLSSTPVIAVSLTRHPGEAHLIDANSIAGFFYLPTLEPDDAREVLAGIRRKRGAINPPNVLPWPGTTPIAQPH